MQRIRASSIDVDHPGIPGVDNRWFPSQGQARRAALIAATRRGAGHRIVHDSHPARGLPHYHVVDAQERRMSGHFFYGPRPPRRVYRGRPWRESESSSSRRTVAGAFRSEAEAELEQLLESVDEAIYGPTQGQTVPVNRSSAAYIRWVQRSLNQILGLRLAEDGIAGPQTRNAIRTFQQQQGLSVDGRVGSRTEQALIAAGASRSQPQTVAPSPTINTNQLGAYTPEGGRAYVPVAAPAMFHCAPNPVSVTPATILPSATGTPDAAIRAGLTQLRVSNSAIQQFEHDGGFDHLRPIAAQFGAPALAELLLRLRYNAAQITHPPHTYGNRLAHRLGLRTAAPLLAPRLLLAIPGHFRELARRAPSALEAHALENLGWLLMESIRADIHATTRFKWWIPPAPIFATPFANPLPALSPAVQSLILHLNVIDTTLPFGDYNARFRAWDNSLAGMAWRLETGLQNSTQGPGLPFYPQLITVPAAVNTAAAKNLVQQAWQQRLVDTDHRFTPLSQESTTALTQCDSRLLPPNVMQQSSFQGMEMASDFPVRASESSIIRNVSVLGPIRPVFDQVFLSIHDLGWNDLLFQTAGAACFRGTKIPNNNAAARHISNHSFGIAVDFNSFENTQHTNGSMDPRIVLLLETLRFRWGRCFNVPDPMHFEYCGAAC